MKKWKKPGVLSTKEKLLVLQTFRIEKILTRDNKKKLALVKWSGHPDKFNSWVSFSDLVDF